MEKCGERNNDPVVHAHAQHLALALANPNHRIGRSIDANLLAERVAGAQHIVDNVIADDGDAGAMFVLEFSEGAPFVDIEI